MSLNLAAALDDAAPSDEWSGSGLTNALPVAVIEPSDVSNVIVCKRRSIKLTFGVLRARILLWLLLRRR